MKSLPVAALAALALSFSAWSASGLERQVEPDAIKACPRQGPGFYEIPGTTTCIRMGGRVTAEFGTSTRAVERDRVGTSAVNGRVTLDSRTDTELGPVRLLLSTRVGNMAGRDSSGPR